MFGLPQTTEVKKQLPKKGIYEKFSLTAAQKDSIDADISRIDIVANVSNSTVPGLEEGEAIKTFYVLAVQMKRRNYDGKSIMLLTKVIPQNMVFALQYEGEIQFAVYHTKLVTSNWIREEDAKLPLTGLNLDTVWNNVVAFIGNIIVSKGNTLAEQIINDEQRAKILRQIEVLERQMRSTSQPRRQRELYAEIKKLKKTL